MKSLTKIANRLMCDLSAFLQINPKFCLPYNLLLEPTNICNLHCPICANGSGKMNSLQKGKMDFELFKTIINELSPYLYEALLWGYGEPIIHERIYDMIKYIENKKIKTVISTNAQLIKLDDARKLVDSGLSRIIIALDGASETTYQIYRKGGKFNNVIRTLQFLNQAKDEVKSNKPEIRLQFIVMKHNEHEIESIKLLAKEYNAKLKLKTAVVNDETKDFLPSKSEYSRFSLKNNKLAPKDKQPKSCPYIWKWATINWDGSIVPCCKDPMRDHQVGSILENNSFLNVWTSKEFKHFRRTFLTDKMSLKRCSICVLPKES